MANEVITVSEEFKAQVKEWLKLTTQKATVSKDIRVMNNRIKDLKEQISDYMVSNRLDVCNVRGGRVQLYTTKSKEPLNRETIESNIRSYMAAKEGRADDPRAGELADYIVEHRGVKESRALRRTGGPKESNDTATSELREQPPPDAHESQDENNNV